MGSHWVISETEEASPTTVEGGGTEASRPNVQDEQSEVKYSLCPTLPIS